MDRQIGPVSSLWGPTLLPLFPTTRSDLKSAHAGKKAKFEGEYRDGYYSGKWWVENDMLCLDYAKLEVFDDCFWIEKLDDKKFKSYQQKTGGTNIETVK